MRVVSLDRPWKGHKLRTLFKYSRSKLKFLKPKAVDVRFKAYHSHLDPIWQDDTFNAGFLTSATDIFFKICT
jgi:hypothetical protein